MRYQMGCCLLLLLAGQALAAPGDVARTVHSPAGRPHGLAYDGKRIWVADHYEDELYALDPKDGRKLATLDAPGGHVLDLSWDPEGERLWILDGATETQGATIYCLDPAPNLTTHRVLSPVGAPKGIAHDGKHLWVLEVGRKGGGLHRIDPADGTTIESLPAPSRRANALAWDGKNLWVADRYSDRLYMIDPGSGDVLMILPAPGPYSAGLDVVGEHLAVVDYQNDKIDFLVREDGVNSVRYDVREESVEFLMTVRNYGPGPLRTADLHIAVPHDLPSQELIDKPSFEPEPVKIEKDRYGQEVAHFQLKNLKPGEGREIRMRAKARLFAVDYFVRPDRVKRGNIPKKVRQRYLRDESKFDIKNPLIRKTVEEVVGKEKNPYWIARRLSRHIQDSMEYELAGGWNVAPKVLERGTGSCSEYTFVFIALCRAAGVPARFAGSMVVRNDDASTDEVFHRWAEIYLPPYGWVPVDVQHGDKPTEAQRAEAWGRLVNRFLITTHGGGGSELMEWNYNGLVKYTCEGPCKVDVEYFAEWEPHGKREPYEVPERTPAPCGCEK